MRLVGGNGVHRWRQSGEKRDTSALGGLSDQGS